MSSDFQSIGFLEAPLHDSYIDNNTFDRTRQLPHYNSAMEVQLGNPMVRNNLIILAGAYPYPADESPLRGVGQNLSEHYSKDFEGNALPLEGPGDIGAYQF